MRLMGSFIQILKIKLTTKIYIILFYRMTEFNFLSLVFLICKMIIQQKVHLLRQKSRKKTNFKNGFVLIK